MKSLKDKINDPKFITSIKAIAKKEFEEQDENDDGWIDANELYHSLLKTYHETKKNYPDLPLCSPKKDEAKMLLDNFDKNKDGRLSLDEYTEMCISQIKSSVVADL